MRVPNLVLLAVACAALAVEVGAQSTGFGRTTLANVRVRAGTADQNAELRVLPRGYPVRVTGRQGDWAEVEMPGGIMAFVHQGRPGRPYVDLKPGGQGLVIVSDLLLRPQPNTDWPAMGKLAPNQEITVLGPIGDAWYRVLAPAAQRAYVWAAYLEIPADQSAAQKAFDAMAMEEREKLKVGDVPAADSTAGARNRADARERLAALDRRLEEALARPGGAPDAGELGRLRADYLAVADEPGQNEVLAEEARRKAVYVQGKEEVLARLAAAESRMEAIAGERSKTDAAYAESLARYREEKAAEMRAAAAGMTDGKYLRFGIGTLRKDVLGSISGVPTYILSKASEDRFQLTSLRYDLAEYVGREIAISGWRMLTPEANDVLRRVQITRLEIVD